MVESSQPAANAAVGLDSLVIALPKGRLLDEARACLERAGYGLREGDNGRQLVLPSAAPHVRYVLAKPGRCASLRGIAARAIWASPGWTCCARPNATCWNR
ncbi:MAG: hypothetical protein V9H69_25195 [Anaerolineae bacterium]